MKKSRDSVGTDAPSGQWPLDGLRASRSKRFVAHIRKYTGQDSSSRSDSGAAMVEMAFIFSILVVLLVGVVTSAIAFGQKNSIENAAREASRYAATYPPPDADPLAAPFTWQQWLGDVLEVARTAAQGNLDGDVDGQYICVYHTDHSQALVEMGGVQSLQPGPCDPNGLPDRHVQVVTGRDSEINAAFFSVDVSLEAPATARYERE